jgi:antitoxin (DNA-binding transcriptional repressor) of toxin-antitoxin stability system
MEIEKCTIKNKSCTNRLLFLEWRRGGFSSMTITSTELKQNLSRYLSLSQKEDVFITKNGKIIAKLANPNLNKTDLLISLFGSLPNEKSPEEILEERRQKL